MKYRISNRIMIDQRTTTVNPDDGKGHPNDTILSDPDVGLYLALFDPILVDHSRLSLKIIEVNFFNVQDRFWRCRDDGNDHLLAAGCSQQDKKHKKEPWALIHKFFYSQFFY